MVLFLCVSCVSSTVPVTDESIPAPEAPQVTNQVMEDESYPLLQTQVINPISILQQKTPLLPSEASIMTTSQLPANLDAGLYSGAPDTLTVSSVPIVTVSANNINAAVTYVNSNAGPHTLLINSNVTLSTAPSITTGNLTIIGIGGERTITPATNGRVFNREASAGRGSLTIGRNITLAGRSSAGNTHMIRLMNGNNFTMLDGSKITGFTTSHEAGAVYVASGSTFTMHGGEITGNHSSNNSLSYATGGVYVTGTTSRFIMTGSSITGNTRRSPDIEPMDVTFGTNAIHNTAVENRTGGNVGVSNPAGFARLIVPDNHYNYWHSF